MAYESDLERSFKRQMEAAKQQLGRSNITRTPISARTGVSNTNVRSYNKDYPSFTETKPTANALGISDPRTGVSNAPEQFQNIRYNEVASPSTGGPATTQLGSSVQRNQGNEGIAGTTTGDSSGTGVNTTISNDQLNPHRPGNIFGDAPQDLTTFEDLAKGRPDSPGQQGTRLGSTVPATRTGQGTFSVIGRQEYDPNHPVAQSLAYQLEQARARNNPQSTATDVPRELGQDFDRDEYLLNSRRSMESQLRDIDEMYRRGKINGRTALEAKQNAINSYRDIISGNEKTDVNRQNVLADFISSERGRDIDRAKLGLLTDKEARDSLLELYKQQAASEKDQRDYALDLSKYNLDVAKYGSTDEKRIADVENARRGLGIREAGLRISAQNAKTNTQAEIRNMWKGAFSGEGTPTAARAYTLKNTDDDLEAVQYDPEALGILQRISQNPTDEVKKEGKAELERLGYKNLFN